MKQKFTVTVDSAVKFNCKVIKEMIRAGRDELLENGSYDQKTYDRIEEMTVKVNYKKD